MLEEPLPPVEPLAIDDRITDIPVFDCPLSSETSFHTPDGSIEMGRPYRFGKRVVEIRSLIVKKCFCYEEETWGLVAVTCQETRTSCSYVLNREFLAYLDYAFG